MKRIFIKKLEMRYFKGMRSQVVSFYNETNKSVSPVVTISGENGTGKSTVMDAFIWCLFGKNAEDKKQFAIKTYDAEGNIIPKVEHEVKLTLEVDGKDVVLTRICAEKWQKKRGEKEESFVGNEERFFVNDVPMSAKEYAAEVSTLCEEDVFKYITNPLYFTSQKPDTQRSILFKIAGEVTDAEMAQMNTSFAQLISAMDGKRIEAYKKELAAKKKTIRAAVDTLPARMDELQAQLPAEEDWAALEQEKMNLQQQMTGAAALANPKARLHEELEQVNAKMRALKSKHEEDVLERCNDYREKINKLLKELMRAEATKDKLEQEIVDTRHELTEAKARYTEILNTTSNIELEPVCPTCGHVFTTEELQAKEGELRSAANAKRAEALQAECNLASRCIASLNDLRKGLADTEHLIAFLQESSFQMQQKINAANSEPVPGLDALEDQRQALLVAIEDAPTAPATDTEMMTQFEQVLERLANKGRRADMQKRIATLDKEYRQACDALAELEGVEYTIEQYCFEKAQRMQDKVNALFEGVRFKLFEQQVNGAIVETCTATINGVPYADANRAARINAGLEIIEVLQQAFEVEAPIFVDNAEAVNKIRPMNAQSIRLKVTDNPRLFVTMI